MKKKLMIIASCALLLLAAGCKKDEPTPAPETFNSDVAAPTWAAPEVSDMTSSMTAVVKVDLKAQYPDKAADFVLNDEDRLAAFIADSCVGVASLKDDLFFLYVAKVNDQMVNDQMVNLRYYSAHYKNLFEAKDAFVFHNDDHLGTIAKPFAPTFAVIK